MGMVIICLLSEKDQHPVLALFRHNISSVSQPDSQPT